MTVPAAPAYRLFGSFRFVLALLVVVSHTWALTFADDNFLPRIGIGNVAVMGFFILSGFIIAEALTTFYAGRPGALLGNRLARIVTPYWAALIVSVGIHAALTTLGVVQPSPMPDISVGTFHTANQL